MTDIDGDELFQKKLNKSKLLFNQFVLIDTEIFKMVGIGQDSRDIYYIGAPVTPDERSTDGLIRFPIYFFLETLKDKVSDEYYQMLDHRWKINEKYWEKQNLKIPNYFIIEEEGAEEL